MSVSDNMTVDTIVVGTFIICRYLLSKQTKSRSNFVSVHFLAKSSSSRCHEDFDTCPYTCSTVINISNKTKCLERLRSNEKISTGTTIRTTGSRCGPWMPIQRCKARHTSNLHLKIQENGYEWSQSHLILT